ncbi:MAG TPA: formylglycine-generating enzyme family protein [Candidatus Dormibacteraeota bacterium]|nr:formylglycine-generating enzyme family protein [Candidatus Dormibacteraeota bacterium]
MNPKFSRLTLAAALFMSPALGFAAQSAPWVYDTPQESFGFGDLDGDGKADVVVVDKDSGKYRVGYQLATGELTWVDNRPSGLKGLSGCTLGEFVAPNHDTLVVTSPDGSELSLADAASPAEPAKPVSIPFNAALGPNMVVGIDIGGTGNTPLDDLFVASIYNSPDPNQATFLRNGKTEFIKLGESPLSGSALHGNRIVLKEGQPAALCYLVHGEKGDELDFDDLSSGKPVSLAKASDLPAGSDYAISRSGGKTFVVLYKPGTPAISARSIEQSGGNVQLGQPSTFSLADSVLRILTLSSGGNEKLFVIFREGEKGAVFDFDGSKAPSLAQTMVATNELLTCAASLADEVVLFARPSSSKFTTRYYTYKASGGSYAFAAFGSLSSLADNDNVTIPEIHERIVSDNKVKSEGEMTRYTNTIPGTAVTFSMVPIKGGEFLMGSPDSEVGRKPDEGPQHKVKIPPFWMQEFEVTWNEYELFMYPDEEHRMRAEQKSDESGDKLADAVTHPSKPYVEMSFGMGKDGFPAIAMTQHAANKYCQWLSAKTGQFYRLPTEAEWEYACRAGTTTTYFFGADVSQLGQYAWYEQNSDFKYQKVGKKKPNPWGLYDMYGNVTEWVLDQYDADYYKQFAGKPIATDPWNKATKPYPHSVRGGSWDDEASKCRSAARRGSDRSWKMQDPQLPKSVWYFSDAQFVGFRIVRPLDTPPSEEMQKYWTSGVERD